MTPGTSKGAPSIGAKAEAIAAYTAAGFALVPLCSRSVAHEHRGQPCAKKDMGKVPVVGGFLSLKCGAYGAAQLLDPAVNYGIVLPETVVVVDVDPRNFKAGDNPHVRLSKAVGGLSSYTVATGGGGLHTYFRIPPGLTVVNSLKDYPGVEFKSLGRQVVGPGSVHSLSGKEYAVVSGDVRELAVLPERLLALISSPRRTAADDAVDALNAEDSDAVLVDDAQTVARYREWLATSAPTSGSYAVACRGRDFGLTPAATLSSLVGVWNARRVSPRTEAELRTRVEHAYKYAKGAAGADNPAEDFTVVSVAGELSVADREKLRLKDEELKWQTDANGVPKKTFLNLLNFLRTKDSGLYRIFAHNELSGRTEFVSPAPWHRGTMPRSAAVTDQDIKMLKGYLSHRYKFEASVQSIEEGVTNVAYHERFHPVREYLTRLKWDGAPRLETWLHDFLGVEDSTYSRAVGRKVLCAAVMRAFYPGVKFDHVLVLEGPQDLGKSTVVEILGGEHASDAPVDPHSRDTVDAMQGRWFIEIAEMEVLRKTDEDALKAFLTRRTDRCRLAYGRSTAEFPRQSVFIATKNPRADGTYLKDDTGNRRWWPVLCAGSGSMGQLDFRGLTKARDQLFAEAMVRAKSEKLYMESVELKALARGEAELRYAEHEWTEGVARWIEQCDEKPETRRDTLTVHDVFASALGGSATRLDQRAVRAISSVLRRLGWTQQRAMGDGARPVWVRASGGVDAVVGEL